MCRDAGLGCEMWVDLMSCEENGGERERGGGEMKKITHVHC